MRTLTGLRKRLGTLWALMYLKDYHQCRINLDASWEDNLHTLWSYGGDEQAIVQHARFMDECGSDLSKYQWQAERMQQKRAA
jgi:hypothetical protein